MNERKEWFSAAELAEMALPAMPTDKSSVIDMAERRGWGAPGREGIWWRKRKGRGGGVEYHFSVLPCEAQLRIAYDLHVAAEAPPPADEVRREELWARFMQLGKTKRDVAAERLKAVQTWDALVKNGVSATAAQVLVAQRFKVSFNTLGRWREMTAGWDRHDWWAALAPHHVGRPGKSDMDDEAWRVFLADYLRPERPNLLDCWRRVADIAPAKGWAWPSRSTVARKVAAMPAAPVVLAREGAEALEAMYPVQQRDRGAFHALEAVNLDGHRWDVFCRWPDGTVARPHMLAIQDLYSGRLMAWRTDRTLHKGLVRLAFGDMVEQFGIPDHCWMDNGRENAAKDITGGVPNRYRFKVLDEDPLGLLPQMGVTVHWTRPYAGQSKPIERAFRDFAGSIAKHPAFAGAYVGNNPMAKPENYGSAAVPIEEFLRVVGAEIVKHNARPNRQSAVCGGTKSFDEAFFASYARAPVRKASATQRRLFLMAAEPVRANARDGAVDLAGNRYWTKDLTAHRGQKLIVRFDPQALHDPVHLFRLDGEWIAEAGCVNPAGFADVDAAREHGRARKAWMKAQRTLLEAERTLQLRFVADLYAKHDAEQAPGADTPEPTVIRPLFRVDGVNALKADEDDEPDESERLLIEFSRQRRLRAVESGDD